MINTEAMNYEAINSFLNDNPSSIALHHGKRALTFKKNMNEEAIIYETGTTIIYKNGKAIAPRTNKFIENAIIDLTNKGFYPVSPTELSSLKAKPKGPRSGNVYEKKLKANTFSSQQMRRVENDSAIFKRFAAPMRDYTKSLNSYLTDMDSYRKNLQRFRGVKK